MPMTAEILQKQKEKDRLLALLSVVSLPSLKYHSCAVVNKDCCRKQFYSEDVNPTKFKEISFLMPGITLEHNLMHVFSEISPTVHSGPYPLQNVYIGLQPQCIYQYLFLYKQRLLLQSR